MPLRFWCAGLIAVFLIGGGGASSSLAQHGAIEGRVVDAEQGTGLRGVEREARPAPVSADLANVGVERADQSVEGTRS